RGLGVAWRWWAPAALPPTCGAIRRWQRAARAVAKRRAGRGTPDVLINVQEGVELHWPWLQAQLSNAQLRVRRTRRAAPGGRRRPRVLTSSCRYTSNTR